MLPSSFINRQSSIINHQSSFVRRPPRLPAAFTLVEALVSISLTAIAASILLLGIHSSLQTTNEVREQTIALGMAQQLLDQVVGSATFGEIDSYDNTVNQPPIDRWGIPLGDDDGEGGRRNPYFQAPAGFFDRWRQEIDVSPLSPADLATSLPDGSPSDYRAVEVRIVYGDPKRGPRELASLRQVVAYVEPLSSE